MLRRDPQSAVHSVLCVMAARTPPSPPFFFFFFKEPFAVCFAVLLKTAPLKPSMMTP